TIFSCCSSYSHRVDSLACAVFLPPHAAIYKGSASFRRKNDLNLAGSLGMRLAVFTRARQMGDSPGHRETSEKDIGVILVGNDLSNEGIPDVLIARDQPNCRSDGEVVEDFHALLIGNLGGPGRELRDVAFQIAADLIVKKANTKAVVFS